MEAPAALLAVAFADFLGECNVISFCRLVVSKLSDSPFLFLSDRLGWDLWKSAGGAAVAGGVPDGLPALPEGGFVGVSYGHGPTVSGI